MGDSVRLREVVTLLDCEVICGEQALDAEVAASFAADLMSDVLAFSTPDSLLLTGLTSVQAVHTADVAECSGIVFVSGKRPAPDALALAASRSLPLLSTPRSLYEACGVLFANGVTAARKP